MISTKQTVKHSLHDEIIYKNQENVLTGKQYLLLIPLTKFFCKAENINKLKSVLNGESKLSLRLIDWFVTNYSKKNLVMYNLNKLKKESNLSKIETDSGIDTDDNTTIEYFSDYFNVFSDYRAQLKSLNKKNFDPFCRRSRIKFFYGMTDYIITTVGQLNFFKWAIENYILEYIENNMTEIETDMDKNAYNKKLILEKTKKKKNKNTDKINNKQYNKVKSKLNDTTTNKKTDLKKDTVLINEKKTTRRKRKELSVSANKSFIIHNLKAIITFD
tara:strand:+ start:53 stop:871 length:819 start_codon:yes stop_codon:yes gene_type:complete